MAGAQPLVIGLGNAYRSDDALGLVAAWRIGEAAPPGLTVIAHEADPLSLLDVWTDVQSVIIIDAVSSGATPGTVHRLDAAAAPLPARFSSTSTHAIGLAELVELARALGRLPPRLIIYAVEGKSYEAGSGLSPECEAAVIRVVEAVLSEVACVSSR